MWKGIILDKNSYLLLHTAYTILLKYFEMKYNSELVTKVLLNAF